MADLDTFRVNPSASPLPTLSAPSPENAGPEQLQKLGQAGMAVGQTAAKIYTDVLQEQNEARVTEALTALNDTAMDLRTGKDGYTGLLGKNAVERPDGLSLDQEYEGKFGEQATALAEGLGNDAQRKAFSDRANAMRQNFKGQVGEHMLKQSDKYFTDTATNAAASGARQVALAGGNAAQIAAGRAVVDGQVAKLAGKFGWGDEQKAEFKRSVLSPAHASAFDALVGADKFKEAGDYLNTFKDEIDEQSYVKAKNTVEIGLIEQEPREAVAGLFAGASVAKPSKQEIWAPLAGNWQITPNGKYGDARPHHRTGDKKHKGIDLGTPKGTPIQASAEGTVRYRKNDPGGYGLNAELVLDNGDVILLAHLDALKVKNGERVSRGQTVALSGDSGNAKGKPHLHTEVTSGGKRVDPRAYFEGRSVTSTRGGGTPTLTNIIEKADELYPDDPKRREVFIREGKTRLQAQDYDKNKAQEEAVNAAYAEADKTGTLSASAQARLVSAGAASSLSGIRSFIRTKRAEAEGLETVTAEASEPTRNIALEAFYAGKLTHEDQLLPYRAQLTKSDYRYLHDTVLKGRAENAANAGNFASINETINRLAPDMKPVLGEDKDGKKAAALRGSVIYAITKEEEALQKPVTEQRRREIALGLMANTALEDRDGRTAVTVPNFNKIPVAQRREVEAMLRRRLGRAPQAWETVQAYNQVWGRMK